MELIVRVGVVDGKRFVWGCEDVRREEEWRRYDGEHGKVGEDIRARR